MKEMAQVDPSIVTGRRRFHFRFWIVFIFQLKSIIFLWAIWRARVWSRQEEQSRKEKSWDATQIISPSPSLVIQEFRTESKGKSNSLDYLAEDVQRRNIIANDIT
jgi:hypothetical protein